MRKIIDAGRVDELRRLKAEDEEAFNETIVTEADALLNTAQSHEELRDRVKSIVDRMEATKGVTDHDTQWSRFTKELRDALDIHVIS